MNNKFTIPRIVCVTFFMISVLWAASCQSLPEESGFTGSDLPSPDQSDVSETSQQEEGSHEESLQQWVETVTFGNTQVTREYVDGKNDYTVTEVDGLEKRVRHFLNREVVFDERSRFNEDGVLESRQTTTVEDGKQYKEFFDRLSSLNKTMKGQIVDKAFQGTIRYCDFNGKTVAEGTRDYEFRNDVRCDVEKLTVFDSEGEVDHYEERILSSDVKYTYREYADADHNILWSCEKIDGSEVTFFAGKKGGTYKSSGDEAIIYDHKGRLIGRCTIQGNNLELVELGADYDAGSAIDRIQELLKVAAEKDWVNEMVLQAR